MFGTFIILGFVLVCKQCYSNFCTPKVLILKNITCCAIFIATESCYRKSPGSWELQGHLNIIYNIVTWSELFSSPGQRPCELLPSIGVRRHPSVHCKLSHLNLLLWNLWTELNQTWQGWSLGGSLSNLCPTAPPSIQDGCCY